MLDGLVKGDGVGTGEVVIHLPVNVFSKHTSKAASSKLVNTILCSPATSFGRP